METLPKNVFKNIYTASTPFQNLGVPGAKSFHLVYSGYGNPAGIATKTANPYYARFASTPTATVVGDAMAQSPTFFSLWIGNNDTLGYATSGGDATLDQITPTATFNAAYGAIVTTLTSKGARCSCQSSICNKHPFLYNSSLQSCSRS